MNILENKKFINFLFAVSVFFFIISLLWSFLSHINDVEIPILGHINADIRINIEADKNLRNNLHVFADNEELNPEILNFADTYATYAVDKLPVHNFVIKVDNNKDVSKVINNMIVFTAHKMNYFSGKDISEFKNRNNEFYLIPFDKIKYFENSKYVNDKGVLKKTAFFFMSLFYNPNFYVIPYCWFLASVLIYLKNKDKINLRFTLVKTNAIWIILLSALIFRLQDSGFPFWSDELYTSTVAGNPNLPLSAIFLDPDNPPLFFLFARIQQIIFGRNEAVLRLLPCIFSILSIILLYFVLKKFADKKCALVSSFLFALNIYAIHSGREFRVYSLCILLSILSFYFLFEIIRKRKNRDFAIYGFIAVLMANSHYFQILVLISNFIFGMFFLDNKSRLKFFIANIIGAVSFLPYFLVTCLQKALLDTSFNKLHVPLIKDMFEYYNDFWMGGFISGSVILTALILIIPKLKNLVFDFTKNDKRPILFLYFLYSVLFIFVSSYLISQIRPIIRPWYFINALGFVIASIALIISFPYKNKIFGRIFIICILFVYFCFGNYVNKDKTILVTFQNLIEFSYYDSPRYFGKQIGLALHDTPDYTLFYKDKTRDYISIVMYMFACSEDDFIDIIEKAKQDVIYTRLEYRSFMYVIDKLSKNYKVSIIRGDKDVIYARIEKK